MRRMASTVEAPPGSTASTEERRDFRPLRPHAARSRAPRRRSTAGTSLYLIPAFLVYGVFLLWPLLQTVWLSLHQWNGYGPQTWIGGANFATLFADGVFRATVLRSGLWTLGGAVVPTGLGMGLALAVRRAGVRGGPLIALALPTLLPATVIASLWVLVYSPLTGLLNVGLRGLGLGILASDWLGDPHLALGALFIAWLWSAVGVAAYLFWNALGTIDHEYYLLARAEGASAVWRFRHVTLPGIARGGSVAALLSAALAAQVFDLIFVTTGGGPGYATMLLPIDVYGRAFGGFTGQGAAAACLQIGFGFVLAAAALVLGRSGAGLDSGTNDRGSTARKQARMAWTSGTWLVTILYLVPLWWLFTAALQPGRTFALAGASHLLDPQSWTGANFAAAWDGGMGGSMATSALLALAVVGATLLLATPAAFALAHLVRGPTGRYVLLGVVLSGLVQPIPVLIIPLFSLLHTLQLLNTVWGIILPEIAQALPFGILLLWATFRGEPAHILEAAAVDGASSFQRLAYVAVPLARPTMAAVAIWAFITSWNQYLLPTVVSQDGSLLTVPTLLGTFLGRYNTDYGPLAAGTILALLPTLALVAALRVPVASGLYRLLRTPR